MTTHHFVRPLGVPRTPADVPAHVFFAGYTAADVFAIHAALVMATSDTPGSDVEVYPGMFCALEKITQTVETLRAFGVEAPQDISDDDSNDEAAPHPEERRYAVRLVLHTNEVAYVSRGDRDACGRMVTMDREKVKQFTLGDANLVADGMGDMCATVEDMEGPGQLIAGWVYEAIERLHTRLVDEIRDRLELVWAFPATMLRSTIVTVTDARHVRVIGLPGGDRYLTQFELDVITQAIDDGR